MLTLDSLRQEVDKGTVDTVIMAFPDLYGRLFGKRYDARFFIKAGAGKGGHACNYLLTTDMDMNPVQGYSTANWSTGYGDYHMVPDLNTLRKCAWLDRTAIVICDLHNQNTHELIPQAPRSVLQTQIAKAEAMGFPLVKAASEVEFFLYKDSYEQVHQKGYINLKPWGWLSEDYHVFQGTREEPLVGTCRRLLAQSGVPVETSKGETGISQHELNVEYTEALNMADRHVVYKQCIREVADSQGVSVTFMAKPHHDQAGSSCHVHLSLHDASGKNLFDGNEELLNGGFSVKSSPVFRQFLAGWMKYTPDMFAFYAPTVNSYKRYRAGTWAPTTATWSYDNRTAAYRVVGSGKSLRIEARLPGADCNPYLVFAASIASGLEGIKNKLELPPMLQGDAYKRRVSGRDRLPTNLAEAVTRLKKSAFARDALGSDVVDHYVHHFTTEVDAFEKHVTDWERRRYFEQI
eukprot:GILI01020347.1.p1 GENE.GILI01020347.1~~GILI01020347.1.p1  ORF type:complete len:506 (-),score=117.38 GILI01020347.1:157-1542(-)